MKITGEREILSLGGGVQSTTIVLLCLEGRIRKPDLIIFSDTGSERPETYAVIEELRSRCEGKIPFEIVKHNDAPLHKSYQERSSLPMVGQAICTVKFKIRPIRRYLRANFDPIGVKPWFDIWIGITMDEIHRVRESDVEYIHNRYPLVEMGWTREDCKGYLAEKHPDLKVQKSGCFMCPYQKASSWGTLRLKHPDLFADALSMEKDAIQGPFKLKGLFRSERSIEMFNATHTLEDFGLTGYGNSILAEAELDDCEGQGGCFL